jgi:hypothetical protein
MLEQETEQIITLLIRRTIGQKAEVRLDELLASRIPRGIKAYLRAEVAGWLTDELRQGRRMAGIVHGARSGGGAASALIHSASLEYILPRAEFVATLDAAVHFLGNYLCRPRWTLRQFLAPGTQPVPAATVRRNLTYVCDYTHLPALIGRYLESRGLPAISSAQLGALIEQIDRLVVQRGSFADLARMAEPMFASPVGDEIPLKPVLVFLEDRNQPMLRDYLEQLARTRGVSAITLSELVRSFAGLDDDARIHSTLYAPPPESPEPEFDLAGTVPEPPAAPEPPPPPPAPAPHDGRNISLSLTFAGMDSSRTELQPLEQLVREEQRKFFIDALFEKDPAFYAGVVDALNRIPSWSEAAGYLRGLFETHSVDPLSDEALEFVEIVQLRYRTGRQ